MLTSSPLIAASVWLSRSLAVAMESISSPIASRLDAPCEFGGFYIDPEGNATFLSRDTLAQKADQTATDFADDGTGISYQTIDFAYDDTLIFNDVTVNRVGGTPQTVQDTSSIETYFIHSGKREGLLIQTDAESLDQATMILQSRKDAIFRIDSIGLNLADDAETARIQAGLELDIFDLVDITKSTPGAGSVTLELFVQGVQHDITTNTWGTKFFTAEPIIQAFRWACIFGWQRICPPPMVCHCLVMMQFWAHKTY